MRGDRKSLEFRLTLKEILDTAGPETQSLLEEIEETSIDTPDEDSTDKSTTIASSDTLIEMPAVEYSIEEMDMHGGYSTADCTMFGYFSAPFGSDEETPYELYQEEEDEELKKDRVEVLEASLRDSAMGSDSLTYEEKKELIQWIAFHPLEFALYRESSTFRSSNVDYSNILL